MRSITSFHLLLLLFVSTAVTAQDTIKRPEIPVDEESRLITYKQVVQQSGTRDELYLRSIDWLNSFYKNPAEVTRTRDRENGILKGVARFKLYYIDKDGIKNETSFCEYDFTLECKDGRYRYTLTNFCLKETSRKPIERWLNRSDPSFNPRWDEYLTQVDAFAKDWIARLEKAMAPKIKKDDSW